MPGFLLRLMLADRVRSTCTCREGLERILGRLVGLGRVEAELAERDHICCCEVAEHAKDGGLVGLFTQLCPAVVVLERVVVEGLRGLEAEPAGKVLHVHAAGCAVRAAAPGGQVNLRCSARDNRTTIRPVEALAPPRL